MSPHSECYFNTGGFAVYNHFVQLQKKKVIILGLLKVICSETYII